VTARATLREQIAYMCERHHDDFVERNRAIFLEFPPDDFAPYAYTYYDGNGTPIYNGYTTDARRRAKEHFKYAPWASWIEDVRYRRCTTAKAARRLESRLGKKIPATHITAWTGPITTESSGSTTSQAHASCPAAPAA